VAIVLAAAAVLLLMGWPAICPCGTVKLWHGNVQSPENSQQIADWYSLSHVVHGLIFCAATWLVAQRFGPWPRFALAVSVEAAWEVLENTPMVIDRYRAVTLAWGYSGDSVLNSLADIACMALGFAFARGLPVWMSVFLGLALELIAAAVIRDNLTLNVIMLLAQNDAIRAWQAS
jgi:hypothetical protein